MFKCYVSFRISEFRVSSVVVSPFRGFMVYIGISDIRINDSALRLYVVCQISIRNSNQISKVILKNINANKLFTSRFGTLVWLNDVNMTISTPKGFESSRVKLNLNWFLTTWSSITSHEARNSIMKIYQQISKSFW